MIGFNWVGRLLCKISFHKMDYFVFRGEKCLIFACTREGCEYPKDETSFLTEVANDD